MLYYITLTINKNSRERMLSLKKYEILLFKASEMKAFRSHLKDEREELHCRITLIF